MFKYLDNSFTTLPRNRLADQCILPTNRPLRLVDEWSPSRQLETNVSCRGFGKTVRFREYAMVSTEVVQVVPQLEVESFGQLLFVRNLTIVAAKLYRPELLLIDYFRYTLRLKLERWTGGWYALTTISETELIAVYKIFCRDYVICRSCLSHDTFISFAIGWHLNCGRCFKKCPLAIDRRMVYKYLDYFKD